MKKRRVKKATRKAKRRPRTIPAPHQGLLEQFWESRQSQMDADFSNSVRAIRALFKKYKRADLLKAIFVSEIWLPNISAGIKHALLYAAAVEADLEDLPRELQINSYEEFSRFHLEISELVPSFPVLEDYFPEPDWGDIRYEFDARQYSILYGGSIERAYDYISAFEILHVSAEAQYSELSGRSPSSELNSALALQHDLIVSISTQPKMELENAPAPGTFERPTEPFFAQVSEWIERPSTQALLAHCDVGDAVLSIGSVAPPIADYSEFGDKVLGGEWLSTLAFSCDQKLLPVCARGWVTRLFDQWHLIEDRMQSAAGFSPYNLRENALCTYVAARIRQSRFIRGPLCAAHPNRGPRSLRFTSALLAKSQLFLVHFCPTSASTKNAASYLESIKAEMQLARTLPNEFPYTSIYLSDERKLIGFGRPVPSKAGKLKIQNLCVIPSLVTARGSLALPKQFAAIAIPLASFLAMVDGIDSIDQLARFLQYWEAKKKGFGRFTGIDDAFGAFLDSDEEVVAGAVEPDYLAIDVHWGSNFRFRQLRSYWSLLPATIPGGRTRDWRPHPNGELSFLEHRSQFRCGYTAKVGASTVMSTGDFSSLGPEDGKLLNFVLECIADALKALEPSLLQLKVFRHQGVLIEVSAESNDPIAGPDDLPDDLDVAALSIKLVVKCNCTDTVDTLKYTAVVNLPAIANAFNHPIDRTAEIGLIYPFIELLVKDAGQNERDSLLTAIAAGQSAKPRFYLAEREEIVQFPANASAEEPKPIHFKRAAKQLAIVARETGVEPGSYTLEAAKKILDSLRDSYLKRLNERVQLYDMTQALPYAIGKADALAFEHDTTKSRAKLAVTHDVTYDPIERFRQDHTEFLRLHRAYRYLIEKLINIAPCGSKALHGEDFSELVAMADWILIIYSASDTVHYDIHAAGIQIDSQWIPTVLYDENLREKELEFSREQNQRATFSDSTKLRSSGLVSDFKSNINRYDQASMEDLHFRLSSMLSLLVVFSAWPGVVDTESVAETYSADIEDIRTASHLAGLKLFPDELEAIMGFLTLTSNSVVSIADQPELAADIPVWEHVKRTNRYTIKPIVFFSGRYHWGPNAAAQALSIWNGYLSDASLPAKFVCPNLDAALRADNEKIELALAKTAYEVAKTFSPFCEKELDLYRRFHGTGFKDIGDFDLLAYLPEVNVLVYAECKDLAPPFTLKDSRRVRERIFGRGGKDRGHFEKIMPRIELLESRWEELFDLLQWKPNSSEPPRLESVYLSRHMYWWMRYPEVKYPVTFLTIDELEEFFAQIQLRAHTANS